MGLRGMIDDMMARCGPGANRAAPDSLDALAAGDRRALAQTITAIEEGRLDASLLHAIRERAASLTSPPVVGITGTGGSGKSSLTDELVRRLRLDRRDSLRMAVLAVDPSRRKTGGALLGDRIRMNAIGHPDVYMRSLATRVSGSEVPAAFADIVAVTRVAGFDIVLVETSGIGQGDAGIVPFVDVPVFVMTPEFGAASQLEKIDMLDFAALVAINKFDPQGGRGRVARREQAGAAQPRGFRDPRRGDAGLRHRRVAVQRRRGDRALPAPRRDPERTRSRRLARRRSPGVRCACFLAHPCHRPRRTHPLPFRGRGGRSRVPRRCRAPGRSRARTPASSRGPPSPRRGGRDRSRCPRRARSGAFRSDGPGRQDADRALAGGGCELLRRRARGARARARDSHRPAACHALGNFHPQGGAAALPRRGGDPEVPDEGESAGTLPLHRGRVPVQARG